MQIVSSQAQSFQEDTQPPGIFYPVLSEAITEGNSEAFLKCVKKINGLCITLQIFDTHIFLKESSNIRCLNFKGECFFGYELEKRILWFQHKQTKGRVQFLSEKQQDLQIFIQILKVRCPQQNFLQKFDLMQKKGKGEKSEVYTTKRKIDGQLFAVKIQKDNSRMKQQIQILKQLHHPNLIYFRQYFIQADNTVYIVMDYENGGSLLSKIKNQILSYKDKLKVVIDMMNALEFLRIKGIVHRDIKPQNILYSSKDGNYKIADFGMSLKIGEKITKISGTPGYMDPEILNQDSQQLVADIKSDIYSMGLVFYQIFTSRQYYSGDSQQQILENNIKALSFRKKTYKSQDSHNFQKKLLQKMIRKRPEDRKNSYQIMVSSTFSKINRQFELENKMDKKSSTRAKTRSSESDQQKFMDTIKRVLKIKSN